jgi:16S rRNA (uracil1498-N3)-methyltransferase
VRRRFFVDKFEGDTAFLRDEAAHHLGRVLRAEPGQVYELSDGASVRLGRIEKATRDTIEFSLGETVAARASRLETTLFLSIVKFDRFEWALEKATELGVNAVVPLSAARSEKALVAAAVKRAERWRKILVESAQQARRLRAPTLSTIEKVGEAFEKCSGKAEQGSGVHVMLSERPDARPLKEILASYPEHSISRAVLAIGPEGGWTDEEFEAARPGGFMAASLGSNILRTETAVAAGLACLKFALE